MGQKLLPQQLVESITNNPEVIDQMSAGVFKAFEDKKIEYAKIKAEARKAKAGAKKEATPKGRAPG